MSVENHVTIGLTAPGQLAGETWTLESKSHGILQIGRKPPEAGLQALRVNSAFDIRLDVTLGGSGGLTDASSTDASSTGERGQKKKRLRLEYGALRLYDRALLPCPILVTSGPPSASAAGVECRIAEVVPPDSAGGNEDESSEGLENEIFPAGDRDEESGKVYDVRDQGCRATLRGIFVVEMGEDGENEDSNFNPDFVDGSNLFISSKRWGTKNSSTSWYSMDFTCLFEPNEGEENNGRKDENENLNTSRRGQPFTQDDLTDVQLQFEDLILHVHGLVLSRLSPVWKQTLSLGSGMEEGRTRCINATDDKFRKAEFEAFVRAMYQAAELRRCDTKSLCGVYRLADKYDVQTVLLAAGLLLQRAKIDQDSICAALDVAYTYGLEDLLKRCLDRFAKCIITASVSSSPKASRGAASTREVVGSNPAGCRQGQMHDDTQTVSSFSFFDGSDWKRLVKAHPHVQVTLQALGKMG